MYFRYRRHVFLFSFSTLKFSSPRLRRDGGRIVQVHNNIVLLLSSEIRVIGNIGMEKKPKQTARMACLKCSILGYCL